MNVTLTRAEFDRLLGRLAGRWRVLGPRRFAGQGAYSESERTGYGEIGSLDELYLDGKTSFSPKEILFPIRETLFQFHAGEAVEPAAESRPALIFLRSCDVHGIHRLDKVFRENGAGADPYYERRRAQVKFVLIECRTGFDSCFCVSMGTNQTDDYACACRFEAERVWLEVKDAELEPFVAGLPETAPFLDFVSANPTRVSLPDLSGLDQAQVFQHELWQEYTARCIACGRCNTSCLTCSCFSMQDVTYDRDGALGERRRVWAGCHIDGFTDMAGGHSFRARHGDRMRFKTMHKIDDFKRRFGVHMCVGCGRCDDVCPEYISFAHCINRLERICREMKHG